MLLIFSHIPASFVSRFYGPRIFRGMPPAIREQSLLDLQAPMPRTPRGEPERGMVLSSDPLSLTREQPSYASHLSLTQYIL